MTHPPMWLQPVGTATRDVTGENNRYLLSSIVSTSFRNCIKGAGIGCIDWPAATQGRLYLVTTGSYLAPKFNGGNSASNLKAPLSTACPFRPVKFLQSGRSAKSAFYQPGFSEPAVGDLNLPAMKGQPTRPSPVS